jgi:hypothetical protein
VGAGIWSLAGVASKMVEEIVLFWKGFATISIVEAPQILPTVLSVGTIYEEFFNETLDYIFSFFKW